MTLRAKIAGQFGWRQEAVDIAHERNVEGELFEAKEVRSQGGYGDVIFRE